MAMDGANQVSPRSVSDQQRLKIGRCLAIGKAISVWVEEQLYRDLVERHTRYVMLARWPTRTPRRSYPRSSSRQESCRASCTNR